MKQKLIIALALLLTSCNQTNSTGTSQEDKTKTTPIAMNHISRKSLPPRKSLTCQFIPIDTANKMLLSYLNSINYTQNDSDLHSIIFDADMVRRLALDSRVKNIKIMFAHSLEYINAGGKDINCGYQSKELTLILSGYDSDGNYITPDNTVLEMGSPCPPSCPTEGTAANDLFPESTGTHHNK